MRSLTGFFVAMLLVAPVSGQAVGTAAPNFALQDLTNQTVQLSDHQGKVVVLFFFGYNCPLCLASAPSLNQNLYDLYDSDPNFVMLGLDTWNGSLAQVSSFQSRSGARYTLLQKGGDYSTAVSITYDRLMVIDAGGVIRFKGARTAANDLNDAKTVVADLLSALTDTEEATLPGTTTLAQNYPNPFNPTTQIDFTLGTSGPAQLAVYNLLGQEVAVLADGLFPAGDHRATLDASALPSGLYLYRLTTATHTETRTMTLLR